MMGFSPLGVPRLVCPQLHVLLVVRDVRVVAGQLAPPLHTDCVPACVCAVL